MASKVLILTALTRTKYLEQWFSAVGGLRGQSALSPRERLAMSGNIFGYPSLRWGCYWCQVGEGLLHAAKPPPMRRQPPSTKSQLTQNVNRVKAEKP